jgi:purine-binding chemotaxis protein CheW
MIPSRAVAEPAEAVAEERLVCFFLGDQELGVSIAAVKETIELKPVTPVFLVPEWVAGVINLRGDVVAVLDLARLLHLPGRPVNAESRIVILRGRAPGKSVSAGLLVDRLTDVRDVDLQQLRQAPSTVSAEVAGFFKGITRVGEGTGAHPLLVLDLERIFESEPLKAFRRRA